jgi:hypothetical protein
LEFWKLERERFPRLTEVARIVFASAATSTSWERSFSLARYMIGHRHPGLSPLTLDILACSAYNNLALDDPRILEELPVTKH